MHDWGAMAGRLPTCVVLTALSGCTVLPAAGMAFPDEAQNPVADAALAARGKSPAAFEWRCIPPAGVASRSNTAGILPRRALSAGRITILGATRDFHHGLLAEPGVQPAPPPPVTPPSRVPDRGTQQPQLPALPPLDPLVVTQLDEAAPLPVLDEQILSLLLSEPLPVSHLLRLLLRETDVSLVLDPGIDETFSGELKDVTLRQGARACAASARSRLPSGGRGASGCPATTADTGVRGELRHHSPRRHQTGDGPGLPRVLPARRSWSRSTTATSSPSSSEPCVRCCRRAAGPT